jgi:hypothetical protein
MMSAAIKRRRFLKGTQMLPATSANIEAAKRQVKKDRCTVHLDGGNGWTTVVAWERGKVATWAINPEGMLVF